MTHFIYARSLRCRFLLAPSLSFSCASLDAVSKIFKLFEFTVMKSNAICCCHRYIRYECVCARSSSFTKLICDSTSYRILCKRDMFFHFELKMPNKSPKGSTLLFFYYYFQEILHAHDSNAEMRSSQSASAHASIVKRFPIYYHENVVASLFICYFCEKVMFSTALSLLPHAMAMKHGYK